MKDNYSNNRIRFNKINKKSKYYFNNNNSSNNNKLD